METIALTLHFETQLHEHHKKAAFKAVDNLITSLTFATRDPEFISEAPETAAKSVLTYIDHLSRKIPLIREHYESLSEWCHPNGHGHYFTFGSLDRDTGTVSFSKRKLHGKGLLDHVLAVYVLLGLVENIMDSLDLLVRDISKTHSAAFPIDWT